jgi:hypothetical protein
MKVSYLPFDAEDGGDMSLRNFVRRSIPEEYNRHKSCYLCVSNVSLFVMFGCPLRAPREPKECVKLVDREILSASMLLGNSHSYSHLLIISAHVYHKWRVRSAQPVSGLAALGGNEKQGAV